MQTGPRDIRLAFAQGTSLLETKTLEEVFAPLSAKSENRPAKWDRQWGEISGGLAAFAFTDVHINSAIEDSGTYDTRLDKLAQKLTASLLQRCTNFCYGLDFAENGELVVQLRMTHASVSKADSSADGIQSIRKVLAEDGFPQDTSSEDLAWLQLAGDVLQSASLTVTANANGTADLVVQGSVSQAEIERLVASMLDQAFSESGHED